MVAEGEILGGDGNDFGPQLLFGVLSYPALPLAGRDLRQVQHSRMQIWWDDYRHGHVIRSAASSYGVVFNGIDPSVYNLN